MKNKFITWFFGLDKEAYNFLSAKSKAGFASKLLALCLAIIMSIAFPVEMLHSITGQITAPTLLVTIPLWVLVQVLMDSLLLRNGIAPWVRLIYSFCLVLMSVLSIFSMVVRPDLDNKVKAVVQAKVDNLRLEYSTEKTARYARLEAIYAEQQSYDSSVCQPEAKREFAYKKYDEKHQHCEDLLATAAALKTQLDSAEVSFYQIYQEELSTMRRLEHPGYFELIQQTIHFIQSSTVKMGMAIILFVFLYVLESVIFFTMKGSSMAEYNQLVEHIALMRKDGINETMRLRAEVYVAALQRPLLIQREEERMRTFFEKLKLRAQRLMLLSNIQKLWLAKKQSGNLTQILPDDDSLKDFISRELESPEADTNNASADDAGSDEQRE